METENEERYEGFILTGEPEVILACECSVCFFNFTEKCLEKDYVPKKICSWCEQHGGEEMSNDLKLKRRIDVMWSADLCRFPIVFKQLYEFVLESNKGKTWNG